MSHILNYDLLIRNRKDFMSFCFSFVMRLLNCLTGGAKRDNIISCIHGSLKCSDSDAGKVINHDKDMSRLIHFMFAKKLIENYLSVENSILQSSLQNNASFGHLQ